MKITTVSSAEIAAEPGMPMSATYWIEKREREIQARVDALAEADKAGQPYVIPMGYVLDYAGALAIARSKHPARVVANTNGYRYARFTECPADGRYEGSVNVHMLGEHIARFHVNAVELWWRGHVTVTSTEALSSLCRIGWFFTRGGKIMFRSYASHPGQEREATEGDSYHYVKEGER